MMYSKNRFNKLSNDVMIDSYNLGQKVFFILLFNNKSFIKNIHYFVMIWCIVEVKEAVK